MRPNPNNRDLGAVIFDFDGLILDTESPVFEAWRVVYADAGHVLSRDRWVQTIGTDGSGFDPLAELHELSDVPIDVEALQARRRDLRDRHIAGLDALPGVISLLDQARLRGLKRAVASSSPIDWVGMHLERLGLLDAFDAIVTREDAAQAKPAPDLYLAVTERVGVAPGAAIAFEDSPNGVHAAKAAGLYCVAVPGPMTRSLGFDHADARVESLADEPLETWLQAAARSLPSQPAADHAPIE
jgi:HAD superfamily hydrolase (TIGR01509 family)